MKLESSEKEFKRLLRENVALAPMTTLGVGGLARYFAEIASARQLAAGLLWARSRGLPVFTLGGGSNIVIADSGFPGLVLRVSIRRIETRADGDKVLVTAGAGEEWDGLVSLCVANNWAGVECLSGIPGRVGATPIQNVGAYGQETSDTIVSIEALDLASGEITQMSADKCEFGYRTSRFKTRDRDRFIITGATYSLAVDGKPTVRYGELQRYLDERKAGDPQLIEVREAVLAIRRRKAMVIDAGDPDSRSVGSFFVNPIVEREEFERVKERAKSLGLLAESIPNYPTADGRVKLPAGWLIERAGIRKGYVHGNVGTSTKHALAIINRGGASGREIRELAETIKTRVREEFGIQLTPEPVFVGFD